MMFDPELEMQYPSGNPEDEELKRIMASKGGQGGAMPAAGDNGQAARTAAMQSMIDDTGTGSEDVDTTDGMSSLFNMPRKRPKGGGGGGGGGMGGMMGGGGGGLMGMLGGMGGMGG